MKLLSLSITDPDGKVIHIPGANGMPTGGTTTLANIISILIAFTLLFAIIFTLLTLIYAGWNWIMSSGDKQKLASARNRLTFAIVGIVIVFAAFLIIALLNAFFNVNLLNLP